MYTVRRALFRAPLARIPTRNFHASAPFAVKVGDAIPGLYPRPALHIHTASPSLLL